MLAGRVMEGTLHGIGIDGLVCKDDLICHGIDVELDPCFFLNNQLFSLHRLSYLCSFSIFIVDYLDQLLFLCIALREPAVILYYQAFLTLSLLLEL
jgi:hypothetical protein